MEQRDFSVKTKKDNRYQGAYFKCETCNKEFYKYPSEIRKSEQNGSTIRYCSMGCYKKTGDRNPFFGKKHSEDSIRKMSAHPNRPKFRNGTYNPNFTRYGEDYGYVGRSNDWWVRKLLKEVAICEQCGFSDKRALCIHHKDRNRKNNVRENLIMLCWNCHAIEHFNGRDGMYKYLTRDIYGRGDGNQKSVNIKDKYPTRSTEADR